MPTAVPQAATVRLDAPTREALGQFMEQSGTTFSQAVRMMVALGAASLAKEEIQPALYAAAVREGITAGAAKLSERVQGAIREALGDMEGL